MAARAGGAVHLGPGARRPDHRLRRTHVRRLIALGALLAATPAAAQPPHEVAAPETGTVADHPTFFGPAEFLEKSYVFYSLPAPRPNPTGFGPEGARPAHALWLIF